MKKEILLGIALTLLTLPTFAQESFRIFENEKYQPLQVKRYEGLNLSEKCLEKTPPTCEAYKASLKVVGERAKSKVPLLGNPAAHYCLDIGGDNRIVKDSSNNQYDYCLFSDGSLVDSWNLYHKVQPPAEKKSR